MFTQNRNPGVLTAVNSLGGAVAKTATEVGNRSPELVGQGFNLVGKLFTAGDLTGDIVNANLRTVKVVTETEAEAEIIQARVSGAITTATVQAEGIKDLLELGIYTEEQAYKIVGLTPPKKPKAE